MAVEYHYQLNGEIHGPIAFRELVMHVREETLSTDDLVKADWDNQWVPAASVVGLFHMAGRDDVLAIWEAEQIEKQVSVAAAEPSDGLIDASSLNVENLSSRLTELNRATGTTVQDHSLEEFDLTRQIADVAAEALNAKSPQPKSFWGKIQESTQSFFSNAKLHRWFRFGSAIVCANFIGILIVNWSLTNMQRFPKPGQSQVFPGEFPIWGECSPMLFITLLIDTMLILDD